MNVALPLTEHRWGRAAWDGIGPLLLIAWSELAPWLLRAIYSVRDQQSQTTPITVPSEDLVDVVEETEEVPELPATQDAAEEEKEALRPLTSGDLQSVIREMSLRRDKEGVGYVGLTRDVYTLFKDVWHRERTPALTERRVRQVCAKEWDALYDEGLVGTPRTAPNRLRAA